MRPPHPKNNLPEEGVAWLWGFVSQGTIYLRKVWPSYEASSPKEPSTWGRCGLAMRPPLPRNHQPEEGVAGLWGLLSQGTTYLRKVWTGYEASSPKEPSTWGRCGQAMNPPLPGNHLPEEDVARLWGLFFQGTIYLRKVLPAWRFPPLKNSSSLRSVTTSTLFFNVESYWTFSINNN